MKRFSFLTLIVLCSILFFNAQRVKYLYMSKGDSLQSKINIAMRYIKNQPVTIVISAGVYKGEEVKLDKKHVSSEFNLTLKARDPNKKPVFEGEGGKRFLTLDAFYNDRSNLHVNGIIIKNYNEGISFQGKEDSGYNSHNSIKNSEFINVGSLFSNYEKSYAVVRLLNSRNNLISKNIFRNNLNKKSGASLLHSIYVAHNSHNNIINENTFTDISGDPIRFRNYSNFNSVDQNKFINSIKTPNERIFVASWYCSKFDCRVKECPSVGNKVTQNEYVGSRVTVDHTRYSQQNTFCKRKINVSKIPFVSYRNVNIEKGLCKIQALEKCPFLLKHNNETIDYLSSTSHPTQNVCENRSRAYYNSCYRNYSGENVYNVIKSTWFKTINSKFEKEKVSESSYGKGCFVKAQNCSRMKLDNHSLKKDKKGRLHDDVDLCLSRGNTWYGSCSRLDNDKARYVEMTFLDLGYEKKSLFGNGCIVSANKCGRMGIADNGHIVEKKADSHNSVNVCLARAGAWLTSCARGEVDSTLVKVEVSFFKDGELVKSKAVEKKGMVNK